MGEVIPTFGIENVYYLTRVFVAQDYGFDPLSARSPIEPLATNPSQQRDKPIASQLLTFPIEILSIIEKSTKQPIGLPTGISTSTFYRIN